MTTTSRAHKIGAFVAKIEDPLDGLAIIVLATCAYREGSIFIGAISVVFLACSYLRYSYPRPPDNNGMVMWGVYVGPWRFMHAAFQDRRAAEQWALEESVGKTYKYAVYPRYGTIPVMVAEDGKLIKRT
jgi:hypothetical protein